MVQVLANGIAAGAVYALVGLGFGLVFKLCGFFHIAHGAVYVFGGYTFYLCERVLGVPTWVSLPIAVACASGFGVLLEEGIYRRLWRRRADPLVMLLASLGILVATQNILSLVFGDATVTFQRDIRRSVNLGGALLTQSQIMVIAAAVVLSSGLEIWLRRTQAGLRIRAVASNPELAEVTIVDIIAVRRWIFFIGSGLAAVAAVLISFDADLVPSAGLRIALMGVVAVVVGGAGNTVGTLGGGLLIGLVQHIAAWKLPPQWQDAIVFLVLIAFLLFMPRGMTGRGRIASENRLWNT